MFTTKEASSALLMFALMTVGAFFGVRSLLRLREKHTGPFTVAYRDASARCYYLIRPNGEIFISCFDNPPEFSRGMMLDDMTYRDDNEDLKHFVKAQFPKGK